MERSGHDRSAWAALVIALLAMISTATSTTRGSADHEIGRRLGAITLSIILCSAAVHFARRSRSPIREIQMALAVHIMGGAVLFALVGP